MVPDRCSIREEMLTTKGCYRTQHINRRYFLTHGDKSDKLLHHLRESRERYFQYSDINDLKEYS